MKVIISILFLNHILLISTSKLKSGADIDLLKRLLGDDASQQLLEQVAYGVNSNPIPISSSFLSSSSIYERPNNKSSEELTIKKSKFIQTNNNNNNNSSRGENRMIKRRGENKTIRSNYLSLTSDFQIRAIEVYSIDSKVKVKSCVHDEPCQHGGICIRHRNKRECLCTSQYTGPVCELKAGGCESHPCVPGSTCEDVQQSPGFICHCAPGIGGPHCEKYDRSDPCNSRPCWNEGSCAQESLRDSFKYRCICRNGFTGKNCKVPIDPNNVCQRQQCHPDAYCKVLSLDRRRCDCPRNRRGENCTEPFNPCKIIDNVCLNDGVCVSRDRTATFECYCSANFIGARCEQPNSESCIIKGCSGGRGDCQQVNGKFFCVCIPGFEGEFCERSSSKCFPSDGIIPIISFDKHQNKIINKKMINETKIGDVTLTIEKNELIETTILAFLHKDNNGEGDYLRIETDNYHHFYISPLHLIPKYENEMNKFVFAKHLQLNDIITMNDGNRIYQKTINKIDLVRRNGKFAILTDHSTHLIDNVLVSSFAHIQSHQFAANLFKPINYLLQFSSTKFSVIVYDKYTSFLQIIWSLLKSIHFQYLHQFVQL
ncbi:hypothetical protein SNEBB_001692 [Seison nebaliae]|nr:hypothetical protein SNEBB_001692 [Seison nebaliae]